MITWCSRPSRSIEPPPRGGSFTVITTDAVAPDSNPSLGVKVTVYTPAGVALSQERSPVVPLKVAPVGRPVAEKLTVSPSTSLPVSVPLKFPSSTRVMLAAAANASTAPVVVVLPLKGVSMLDSPGGQFWDPEADHACYDAIRQNLKPGIPVIELDYNINDAEFADKCAALMLEMLRK